MRPRIEDRAVLVGNGSGAWDGEMRQAQPHEIVPALIEIIADLQDKVNELEMWRSRASR